MCYNTDDKISDAIHKKICNLNEAIFEYLLTCIVWAPNFKGRTGINIFLYLTLLIIEIPTLESAKNFIRMIKFVNFVSWEFI